MSASDFLYDRKCLYDCFQYFQRRASTDTLNRPNVLLWFQIQDFKKKVELKASCLEKCHYYEIQDYINHQSKYIVDNNVLIHESQRKNYEYLWEQKQRRCLMIEKQIMEEF